MTNSLAYTTEKTAEQVAKELKEAEKNSNKKKRGPNYTPPSLLRLPSNATFTSWSKSLESQTNHLKLIIEEADKCAKNKHYKPKMKISKRFQHFFDQEVIEAHRRAKRKNKKKNKNGKKDKKIYVNT